MDLTGIHHLTAVSADIRENKRFTIFDVDPASARQWARLMQDWAERNAGDSA